MARGAHIRSHSGFDMQRTCCWVLVVCFRKSGVNVDGSDSLESTV